MPTGVVARPGGRTEVVLVFDYSKSNPLTVDAGSPDFTLLALEATRRTKGNAPTSSASFIDRSGNVARRITYGMPLRIIIEGTRRWSGFIVDYSLEEVGPAAVRVDVQAQGLTRLVYATRATADDATLPGRTTHGAAEYVAQTWGPGVFGENVGTISPSVTVPTPFDVSAGESVGNILDRLTDMDGADFWLEDDHEASALPLLQYEEVDTNAVSATVPLSDLLGHPYSRAVQVGTTPPKNSVRIRSPEEVFQAETRQETRDSYYDLDATTKWAAQRFKAPTARLSAVELWLDRTADPNQPGALGFEVQTEGTTTTDRGQAGTYVARNLTTTADRAAQTFTAPDLPNVRLTRVTINGNILSGSPSANLTVHAVDGSNKPTGAALATFGGAIAGASTNYSLDLALTRGTKYSVVLYVSGGQFEFGTTATLGTGMVAGFKSTDSGASWTSDNNWYDLQSDNFQFTYAQPSGTRVEWSNDVSFTATDSPYPPDWGSQKTWTKPKLSLTKDAYYWIIAKASSDASGTKKWRIGYQNATDPYADGDLFTSTDSGATWTKTGKDATFRLFYASDPIDITRTNARTTLTAGINDSTLTIPVAELRDFSTLPTNILIGSEEITITARSATTGAGNLTASTRGAAGTTAAAHSSGDLVDAYSVKTYGIWHYEEANQLLQSLSEAENVASLLLTRNADPGKRYVLPFKRFRSDVTPYAPVTVQRPLLGLVETVVPREVSDILTQSGEIITVANAGTPEYNVARAIEELRGDVT